MANVYRIAKRTSVPDPAGRIAGLPPSVLLVSWAHHVSRAAGGPSPAGTEPTAALDERMSEVGRGTHGEKVATCIGLTAMIGETTRLH